MSDTAAAAPAAPLGDLFTGEAARLSARGYSWSPEARSLGGVHRLLSFALYIYILVQAVAIIDLAVMLYVFSTLTDGSVIDDPTTAFLANLIGLGGRFLPTGSIVVLIVCIICYLLFVHRAMQNLHLSNARGLTVSPGMAVGWSFIPFANLGMIYSVMKQIWSVSADPEKGRRNAPMIFTAWWGLWLGGNLVGRLSDSMTPKETDTVDLSDLFSQFLPGVSIAIVSGAAAIISTLCLLAIIGQIKASQETLRSTSAFDD